MGVHLLYFRYAGAERFGLIHGGKVARFALADVARRFAAAARSLLRQHAVLSPLESPRPGVWAIAFELKPLEIEADEREQLESIAAAGRVLAVEALADELGSAVALHAGLEVGTVPVEKEDSRDRRTAKLLARLRRAGPARAGASTGERALVLGIVRGPLTIYRQRIVSLASGETAAYEALLRGPPGGSLRRPELLLAEAARFGRLEELELAALDAALAAARRLPFPLRLAVNLSPGLFGGPALRRIADEPDLPGRLIFEITEHLPIPSPGRLNRALRLLRGRGAQIALDDAGCGYLNMELVRALRPDIVKLCITLTRRLGKAPGTVPLVRRTVAALGAAGALALAEGVETAEQARLALECGCDLAQGWYFGRPRPAFTAPRR
ncbi:MAG: EAL domain-containing protein [Elusimicrobia bacterium]|nr:EAL domain-containing protein [Elusimicrobiota bacterium]